MNSILNNTDLLCNVLVFSIILGSIIGSMVGLIWFYIKR